MPKSSAAKSASTKQKLETSRSASTVEIVGTIDVPSYYVNNTGVETTVWDICFRFAETIEIDRQQRITKVRPLAIVRMSPQHARVVVGLLQAQLEKYEQLFGKIPEPRPTTEPPPS